MSGNEIELVLDTRKCMGYGNCVAIAPDIFALSDETGIAVIRNSSVNPSERDRLEEAVRACPVAALKLKIAAQKSGVG